MQKEWATQVFARGGEENGFERMQLPVEETTYSLSKEARVRLCIAMMPFPAAEARRDRSCGYTDR